MGLVKWEMAYVHKTSGNPEILGSPEKRVNTCKERFSVGSLEFLSLADIAPLIYPDSPF